MSFIESLSRIIEISPALEVRLSALFRERLVKKNEMLVQAGELCSSICFVEEGALRGFYFKDGKDISNWFALGGDFATSFYAFFAQGKSYENIQALENARLRCLHYNELQQLYRDFPETERLGRIILEEYYSRLEERLISIQFRSAKERYDHLMLSRPEVFRRIPLGHIASYLGITQETLSRIRAAQ